MSTRHHQHTIRGAIPAVIGVAVAAALAVAGCAGVAGDAPPSVVTVTSTVRAAPGGTEAPGGGVSGGALSPDSSRRDRPSGRQPSASPADKTVATRSKHSAPTPTVSRLIPPDPERSGTAAGAPPPDGAGDQPATGPGSRQQTSGAEAPPGTPSLGDLFAAAARDASAAGVAPADPDTSGPETGPACAANNAYVDEAPTGLRADVVTGWQQATKAAAADGIMLCLNDGKRSRAQQQAQFDDYAEQYGEQVAEQLVLPPDKSAHVVGIAIDVQPATGYGWLQSTAGSLGFCRMYDNEPWHFEFNPAYRHTGCPQRLPEPPR